MLRIERHLNKIFSSVSYVLFDDVLHFCWIIDVGDSDVICNMILGYELKGVFLTHVHYDHIYGLNELQKQYPHVSIYTNEFGLKSLSSPTDNLSAYHEDYFILKDASKVVIIKEGDLIDLGNFQIIVWDTPGHDYSCLSYLIEDACFTGDAYIPGVKVFTKLQNGDSEIANQSRQRLKKLLNFNIYPGHIIG